MMKNPRRIVYAISIVALVVFAAAPASAAMDSQAVADAYGDLTVFMLNVAAGNDGQPQKPQAEQQYKVAFANLFAQGYAGLSPDDQQALTILPTLDAQLHQAWPTLPGEQRNELRDQWAAGIQELTAGMPCELFDSMARAQLLPSYGQYEQPNISRLRQCWHDHPELTLDPEERASGDNYGKTAAPGGSNSHAAFMGMFNANLYRYTASMNSASMGTATYTVKSWP